MEYNSRGKIIDKELIDLMGIFEIKWEYEDELECDDITIGMYQASKVDVVRMYPYVKIKGRKHYLEKHD